MPPSRVPQKLRDMVIERAGWCCDRCGRYLPGQPYSLQHRRARGRGGRRVGAHTPANLVVLCGSATTPGSCHFRVESRERTEAYAQGFAICGELARPEDVPIYRHLTHWVIPGDGVWIESEPLAA